MTIERILIFDVGADEYRLVVHVACRHKRVLVKFIGTHKTMTRSIRRMSDEMDLTCTGWNDGLTRSTLMRTNVDVRPIQDDEFLGKIGQCLGNEPQPGGPEGDRFDVLATLIEAYKTKRFPIEAPAPIEVIRFVMEQRGLSQADLAKLLGPRLRASESRSGRRRLTVDMIALLSREWRAPAGPLLPRPEMAEPNRG